MKTWKKSHATDRCLDNVQDMTVMQACEDGTDDVAANLWQRVTPVYVWTRAMTGPDNTLKSWHCSTERHVVVFIRPVV